MQAIRYIFLLMACLAGSLTGFAQGLVIRNYNVKDGLANATVYSAVQDAEGFIWFATPTGASKFDGKRFRNYTKKDGLTDNDVLKLASDSRGRIWFLTSNGKLSFYQNHLVHNEEQDSTLRYNSRSHYVQYAFEDRARTIWFLNSAGRIIQYNGKKTTYDKLGPSSMDVLSLLGKDSVFHPLQRYFNLPGVKDSNNVSQKIFLTSPFSTGNQRFNDRIRNNPVVITGNTLYSYTPQDIMPFFSGTEWGIREEVSSMSIDGENLWIGTPRALYLIRNFFQGERVLSKLLNNHAITSILHDRDGNTWITTLGDGVYHIPFKHFYFAYLDNTNGLYSHSVYSVFKDKRNGLLYIGENAGMLNVMPPGGNIRRYELDSTGGRNSVLGIMAMPNTNELVIATDNTIFNYAAGGPPPKPVLRMRNIRDMDFTPGGKLRVVSRNRLALGTDGRMVDLSALETQVSSIASVDDSSYYLGTGSGLFFGRNSHLPVHVQDDPRMAQSIKDLEWINGYLWVGTSDQGIFVLKDNQVVRHFRAGEDLVSDICQQLYYDGNGRLYVATNRGVSIIDTRTRTLLRNLTSNDGLMSDDIRGISHAGDTLYVATSNGLCYFSRDHIPVDTVPPTVYLNAIRYGDSTWLPRPYFQHIYERNSTFEVEFGAIAFDLPELVEYQYNFSNDTTGGWVTTMSTIVPYPKLQPGDYTLLIRARKYKSGWSKPVVLRISVLPRWYQEWWARGILVLLGILAILLILRYIVSRIKGGERRKTEYNRRIAELEAKALTNQMNPHFIFNSLNSVQHLILEKEEKQALNFLADFATLMRQMLNNSRKSYLSLEDEVAFLTRYIELEKIRFANSFEYKVEMSQELKEYTIYIPPMLIQPILENAIKHGLAPKNGSGHLLVRLEMQGDLLYCAVDDDGIGWEHANSIKTGKLTKHESTALSVIRERLQIIKSFNGSVGKLEIIDKFNSGFGNKAGTLVEILIPIVKML
ncbi:sensor histidine kinase [Chitinophaga deserti]|uniref:sensor histidine kinase n=1 Tax=Chitinophaga deserti TaxID=2164099 RepID=UPI000D6D03BD|nr:histidine kinase [Chitinophaga deserti]